MSEKKYYLLTDSKSHEAFGPFSKEEIAELDIPETMLVCIPSQNTGLKPANTFHELVNLVVSVEMYNLSETDTTKVFYIKHGKQYSELSFDELRNTVFKDTTPIGIGSNKKWYYAGNIEHLKELLNERPPFVPNNDGDAPILEFEEISDGFVRRIEEEITTCSRLQSSIEKLINNSDEEIRRIYKIYVSNFKNMEASMERIETMVQSLDGHYKTAQDKLASNLPARKKFLQRAYEEKKENVLSMVSQLVEEFTTIKPFDQCKGYQISPITEWNEISTSSRFPQHFLYLGKIHRKYKILGQDFEFSRRDYLELLNFQNLTIHYDNKSMDKSVSLVSTLLCRMLKATRGDLLDICVIDPKMGLGLNNDFRTGLPSDKYKVVEKIDPEDIWNHEKRILKMTGGLPVERYYQSRQTGYNVFHIVVFQDWHTTMGGRIDEDMVIEMINNSACAGYCFIFMVNDDNKPDENSQNRREEDDLLSRLPRCAEIDLKNQMDCEEQQLELMNEEHIFEVVKEVRNNITSQSLKIDIGALLEEKRRWGVQSCNEKITLSIGKINYLKNLELSFADHIIDHYLIVSYREAKSNVIQWINAMIAQAFTLYNPEELNVMLVDFLGNEELARLTGNRTVLEPPFYYLGLNKNNSRTSSVNSIGNQIPRIFNPIISNPHKRMLAFIIGKEEEIRQYVIIKSYHKKDRLHVVLLTTDFVIDDTRNQNEFEGYQISFGPMRIDSRASQKSQTLSGDEFLYEGNICQAYTYDIEDTCQIIRQYVKIKPTSITSKPTSNINVNNTDVTLGSDKPQPVQKHQTDIIEDNTSDTAVTHNDEIRQNTSSVATNNNIEISTVGNTEVEVKPQEPISADIPQNIKNTETMEEAKPEEPSAIVTPNSVDLQQEQTTDEGKENQAVVDNGSATNPVVGSTTDSNTEADSGTGPGSVTDTVSETLEDSITNYADDSDTNQDDDYGFEEEQCDYQKVFQFKDIMLPETEWWKESCANSFEVPFGIHINWEEDKKETRYLQLIDDGGMQNAAFFLGGQGSGKSTFLNALIICAAQRYSPKELEFYLIDFKNVGFLPYELYKLPHARVVAFGDDADYSLSILKKIQSILSYRKRHSSEPHPRTVLILDECHYFFKKHQKTEEAKEILEFLIREGRAFSINVIFATQMLSSTDTQIPDSIYRFIGTWIIAMPSVDEYQKIFGRRKQADADTLHTYGKGEMMFVPKGMRLDLPLEDYHAKSFYIQYNDKEPDKDSELKNIITRLANFAQKNPDKCPSDMGIHTFYIDQDLKSFNIECVIEKHRKPVQHLPDIIPLYLGQEIAVAQNDIYFNLSKDHNQNIIIMSGSDSSVGQGIACNALLSSLYAYPINEKGRVDKRVDYIFDFTIKDDPLYGQLQKMVKSPTFNSQSKVVQNKKEDVINLLKEITEELKARIEDGNPDNVKSHIFITIFGLERGAMFGKIEATKFLEATNLLKYILSNGPAYGIFTMIQITGITELLKHKTNVSFATFNHVIALKMEDASSLVDRLNTRGLYDQISAQDSPGLYRAVYYSRLNQSFQKFKPYKF